jgi:hypothetical protein
MPKPTPICVDFDGTCVTHDYPKVGKNIGAQKVLKELVEANCKLILFTMRDGQQLQDAVDWFKANDIELWGIQTNPTQKNWTKSPKAYGKIYIDDAALGCPVIHNTEIHDRAFVDWDAVREDLVKREILSDG